MRNTCFFHLTRGTLLASLLLLAACEDASIPTAADHAAEPSGPDSYATSAGKGPGTPNSSARLSFWNDPFTDEAGQLVTPMMTSIGGDYVGNEESVHATILYYDQNATGGTLLFDPDKNRTAPERKISITFPITEPQGVPTPSAGQHESGAYFDLRGMMQVTDNNTTHPAGTVDTWIAARYPNTDLSRLRTNWTYNEKPVNGPDWRLKLSNTGITNCEAIVFEKVKLRRIHGAFDDPPGKWDITQPGEWEVESVGDHRATCSYVGAKNKLVEGASYALPFKMTVVEIRP